MNSGKVILLGAGPGDLELLTVKAVKRLREAHVVLLDDLVDPAIVDLAPQARIVRVGKRGGCRSTPQSFILRLMRRYALRGETVARVKGGDVLVFGRGGEEIRYLREHGIEIEIVNGISSGLAAAASLGISLTHRDHCRGVTFVTAHAQDGSQPDWSALVATGTTLVIYMGMSRLSEMCAALARHLPNDTPTAAVQWASTARERRVIAPLDELARRALAAGLGSPAVILVGAALGEAVSAVADEPWQARLEA